MFLMPLFVRLFVCVLNAEVFGKHDAILQKRKHESFEKTAPKSKCWLLSLFSAHLSAEHSNPLKSVFSFAEKETLKRFLISPGYRNGNTLGISGAQRHPTLRRTAELTPASGLLDPFRHSAGLETAAHGG